MATNNPVNEVHSNDNQIFDNVDYQLSQEMHQEEHLDSDAETEIDDNTIPYHQYLLDTEAQNVPTEEQALVIQRNKRNAELVQENDLLKSTLSGKEKSIAFLQSEKEKILSEKKDLADSYLDEICIDTSSASNAIFEINKLRDQLQGKDTTIWNLDAQATSGGADVGSTEGSCDQQALTLEEVSLKDAMTSP
ncbi:hypothetical protein Tco_1428413 [Tanacetum coccineum]